MTNNAWAHAEAAVNTIAGIIIAQVILGLWGMSFTDALMLNVAFIVASYIRMYVIRMVFHNARS